jgi:hypothetical protein
MSTMNRRLVALETRVHARAISAHDLSLLTLAELKFLEKTGLTMESAVGKSGDSPESEFVRILGEADAARTLELYAACTIGGPQCRQAKPFEQSNFTRMQAHGR